MVSTSFCFFRLHSFIQHRAYTLPHAPYSLNTTREESKVHDSNHLQLHHNFAFKCHSVSATKSKCSETNISCEHFIEHLVGIIQIPCGRKSNDLKITSIGSYIRDQESNIIEYQKWVRGFFP